MTKHTFRTSSFEVLERSVSGPHGILPMSMGRFHDGFIFISGQLGLRDGAIYGSDITAQAGAVIDNIETELKSVGLNLRSVIKTTVWLTDASDFMAFNEVYRARFTAPYPARSTLVSRLVIPDARIEIEAIAAAR